MFSILKRPDWFLPEKAATPEQVYFNRRRFLQQMGFAGAGLFAAACSPTIHSSDKAPGKSSALYPAPRNPEFNPDWAVTDESVSGVYNNFFEFTTVKNRVHRMTDKFVTTPWPIEIGGLVEKPLTIDAEELAHLFPLEERVYRFRCVEAWAMIVPWTGFPLSKLLQKVEPKSEAKFVRFVTFFRPDQAPGQLDSNYPWPYTEGLRLDEAMHPLTLVTTGIYGKPLGKQFGAPVRLVVPWKYGYKSIKSIVKIELVAQQPKTLWESMAPHEYPFESNVNPAVPHPRWSQATERMIDSGIRVKTKPYNGYGDLVGKLYTS